MAEITPRILLYTLNPLPDGSFTLGKPALELGREEATYRWESDTERTEKVRLAPDDAPKKHTVVCRTYYPGFEEIYIQAKDVK